MPEPLDFSPHSIGIDEAGRGPLAGPLVVCACKLHNNIPEINDSKKISHKKRLHLSYKIIKNSTLRISIVSPLQIDTDGIFPSVMNAMRVTTNSLLEMVSAKDILVDGPYIPDKMPINTKAEIKGDGKFQCIAAAGIVAKVVRDYIMVMYTRKYPVYGFERNKGYGTKEHYKAIREHGICELHRRSFRL